MKLKNIWRLADISGSYSVAKDIWNDFTPEGVAKLLESKENRLDRAAFLWDCLGPYYPAEQVEKAIAFSPAQAEIPPDVIDRLADICIRRETKKAAIRSAAAGIPGGIAAVVATVYDARQFNRHVILVMQKLLYLYGWPALEKGGRGMEEEIKDKIRLFYRIMCGDKLAGQAVTYYSKKYAEKISDQMIRHTLKNGIPVLKKGAEMTGAKVTEKALAGWISKSVPLVGGAVSGSLTYLTFYPMARRLQRFLQHHPNAYVKAERAMETEE